MDVEVRTQQELEEALARKDVVPVCVGNGSFRVGKSSRVVALESARVVAQESSRVEARDSSRVVARDSSSVEAWGRAAVAALESSHVVARDSSRVEASRRSSVEAWGSSQVVALGFARVDARESTRILARGSSTVVAGGSSSVVADRSSSVEARGSSRVQASGRSSIEAWESSRVVARGSSRVLARDSSRIEAWGSSSVEARNSSTVVAREASRVVARGSSRVVAWDSSCVEAWDSCRVEAFASSRVLAHGSRGIEAWESSTVEALGSDSVRQHPSPGTARIDSAKGAVGTSSAGDRTSIPRTVHRIWLGDKPEPDWTRPFAATWQRPGWTVRQWSGPEELWPLTNQDLYDRADEIAPRNVWQLRADILRYEIILRLGGVYVDVDFECLRPIDELLEGVRAFAVWSGDGRALDNAALGAEPEHPFFDAVVKGLAASVEARRWDVIWLSGPAYLTRVWWECDENVTTVPPNLFYPYARTEIPDHDPGGALPDAYAIHHWRSKRHAIARALPRR